MRHGVRGSPTVCARSARTRSRVVALAQSDEIAREYDDATEQARRLGIFGAPTFVARGEVFWGDDRLEDAVTWHQRGTLGAPRAP